MGRHHSDQTPGVILQVCVGPRYGASRAVGEHKYNNEFLVFLFAKVTEPEMSWVPVAAAIAAALAAVFVGYKFFAGGAPSSRKILKPDTFQEFPLIDIKKTSHNVAIYRFGLPKPTDILGLPIGQHMSLAATPKAYPQGNISAHMATL